MSACSRGRCRFGRAHGAEVGRWVSCRPLRIFETYFLNEAQTSNKKADISAGLVCWRISKTEVSISIQPARSRYPS